MLFDVNLQEELVRGKIQPHRLSQVNIHVVTGALKQFLKTLKEPLITFTLWKSFVGICDLNEEMDVQTAIYALVPDLPQPNRDTLAYLILHIQKYSTLTFLIYVFLFSRFVSLRFPLVFFFLEWRIPPSVKCSHLV